MILSLVIVWGIALVVCTAVFAFAMAVRDEAPSYVVLPIAVILLIVIVSGATLVTQNVLAPKTAEAEAVPMKNCRCVCD
jgi:hypothetical protein